MDYLTCTYGGLKENPLENNSFFCYTIYDKIYGLYYSGSKGVNGKKEHNLFRGYWTSSTLKDFKKRLKTNPQDFEYIIEYFYTRKEAFEAEAKFHKIYDVKNNKMFYNMNNCSSVGFNTAGAVLCRDENGKSYLVSKAEFDKGSHTSYWDGYLMVFNTNDPERKYFRIKREDFDESIHSSHAVEMMMVYRNDDLEKRLFKIPVSEFDEKLYTTQFKDHVLCFDVLKNKKTKIPSCEYFNNPDRYVSLTKDMVTAIDIETGETVSIKSDIYYKNRQKYINTESGFVHCIDVNTGEKIRITTNEFHTNRNKYKFHNDNMISCYSIALGKNVRVSKEEYHNNENIYANSATKYFFIYNGKFLKNKNLLKIAMKDDNIVLDLHLKPNEIVKKFPQIKLISKEEHSRSINETVKDEKN